MEVRIVLILRLMGVPLYLPVGTATPWTITPERKKMKKEKLVKHKATMMVGRYKVKKGSR